MKKLLLLVAILLMYLTSQSSILGADLTYKCIGKDSFIVTLNFYAGCSTSIPDSITIPIRCKKTNTLIRNLTITKPTPIDVTPVCATQCTSCDSLVCTFMYGIELYKYEKFVHLTNVPAGCCEITFSYSKCCRSSQITTGPASQNLYTEAIGNRCVTPYNSSPQFSKIPLQIICLGQDLIFNNGVYDLDIDSTKCTNNVLDSLSYEWSYPLSGPGANISYTGKYDYNMPVYFWGFPNTKLPFPRGFHLDKYTGNISFRPLKEEVTVMAITIKEWRYDSTQKKRVVIGQIRRDMQLRVINCPNNHPPLLSWPYFKEVCVGDTLNFSIRSNDYDPKDTVEISWNASIQGGSWSDDNDTAKHPTGVFTWTPKECQASNTPYTFTVSVKDNACPIPGTSTRAYQILVHPLPKANIDIIDSGCGNYWLHAKPISGASPSYSWVGNFNPGFADTGQSIHHKFFKPGAYPYSMTMSTQTCKRTFFDTLVIKDSFIKVQLPDDTIVCYGEKVKIKPIVSYNKGTLSNKWYYLDANKIPHLSKKDTNSQMIYQALKDTQIIYLATDTLGCQSQDTIKIKVIKPTQVLLSSDTGFCSTLQYSLRPIVKYGDITKGYFYWITDQNMRIDSSKTLSMKGSGTFTCYFEDTFGCVASDSIKVIVNPEVIAFANGTTICLGDTAYLSANETGSKTSNVRYYWYDGSALVKTGRKIQSYNTSTTALKLLVTETSNGYTCKDSMYVIVKVNPLPEIKFTPDMIRCISGPNSDFLKLNNYIQTTPASATKIWSYWKKPGAINVDRFDHTLAGIGNHIVSVRVTDPVTQCYNTDSTTIQIIGLPVVYAGKDDTLCNSDGSVPLNGIPSSPSGTWKNVGGHSGVEGHTGNWSFNPAANGVTPGKGHEICYIYTDSNGCQNSDTLNIFVFETPIAKFGAMPIGNTLEVSFKDSSGLTPGSNVYWLWHFGDGDSSTQQHPTHTYADTGTFLVLQVVTVSKCVDSYQELLYLYPNGIEKGIGSIVKIYPNPTDGLLHIQASQKIESIILYNVNGKKVLEYINIQKPNIELDLSKFSEGAYMLKVGLQTGYFISKNILIN